MEQLMCGGGGHRNGELMLLLVHNHAWRGRHIRLIRMIHSEVGHDSSLAH